MKLVHPLPISALLVTGLGNFRANAFVYSSGPLPRSYRPSKSHIRNCANGDIPNFASSPRNDRYRQRQDRVNQAFRELQDEIGDNQRDSVDGQFNWVTMGSPQDPFQKVDKEATKKWVEMAFNLASEFNKDFAATSKERDATDEILHKSRDWVARMYKDQIDGEDSSLKQRDSPISSKKSLNTPENTSTPTAEKHKDFLSETPNSENRSNEEMFQVAIDLPGVDRGDVDVTLDGDFLVIGAMRNPGSDGQPMRKYSKKIAFVENEVDMDKMEASLKNGVLVVSAPKNKVTEIKRKIPIN